MSCIDGRNIVLTGNRTILRYARTRADHEINRFHDTYHSTSNGNAFRAALLFMVILLPAFSASIRIFFDRPGIFARDTAIEGHLCPNCGKIVSLVPAITPQARPRRLQRPFGKQCQMASPPQSARTGMSALASFGIRA